MKIRIGLIGCGRISLNHLTAIKDLSQDYELVAVCDTNEEARSAASRKYNVAQYSSIDSFLDSRSNLDMVSICTPSGMHPDHGIASARAGLHVVTEKPMATRLDRGIALVQACEDAGKQLFVVKQNRLNQTMQLLKRTIDSGRFGKISNISSNVFWTRPQEYYDHAKWRGTWDMDGGAFMNQASHYIDLLTWLIGPLERLSSFNATLGRKIEAEDCGVIALKFRSGTLGTMNVSMLTYPQNFEGSITIIGEKGLARIGGIALNKVESWQFADKHPDDEIALSTSYETNSVYGFGHQIFYSEVAKAIRGEPNQATTGRNGLTSLSTLVAAYRSSINGGSAVGFPLDM